MWCFICTPDQSNVTLDRLGYIFDFSSVLMLHNCLKKSWARSDLSGSVGSTGPGPGRTKLHAPGCLRKLIWQPMKNNPCHYFFFFYYFYCFGPAQENIDIATTNIPQNSGLIMIRLILTKIHCKNRREKNGRDCFSWIAISTF